MTQPDRFQRMAHKQVTAYFSREGTNDKDVPSLAAMLLRREHQAVRRKVSNDRKVLYDCLKEGRRNSTVGVAKQDDELRIEIRVYDKIITWLDRRR